MKIKYIDVTSIKVGQDDAVYNDEAKQTFNKLSKNEKIAFLNEQVETLSENMKEAYDSFNNTAAEIQLYYKDMIEDTLQSIAVYPDQVYVMDRYEKQVIDETEQYVDFDKINVKVISKIYTEPTISEESISINGYMVLSDTENPENIYAIDVNAKPMNSAEENAPEVIYYELYKVGANLQMTSQNLFVILKNITSEEDNESTPLTPGEEIGRL